MRPVLCTLNLNNFLRENARASLKSAAERWGLRYEEITKATGGERSPFGQKLRIGMDEAPPGARVLFVDADVLIREDCPNLLDMVPVGHFGAVANCDPHAEERAASRHDRVVRPFWERISGVSGASAAYSRDRYFNSGVMVFEPSVHRRAFARAYEIAQRGTDAPVIGPMTEQTALNIALLQHGLPITLLPRDYNRTGKDAWQKGPMRWPVQHLARCPGQRDRRDECVDAIQWRVNGPPAAEKPIGFGRFPMPEFGPLILWRPDGSAVDLENFYRGRACALVCGGPSLKETDLSLLDRRGLLTMGINQSWATHRPHLWTAIDGPGLFIHQGWYDPGIIKLVPFNMAFKPLRRKVGGVMTPAAARPVDMPGVLLYQRGVDPFRAGEFLTRQVVSVGCEPLHTCEDGIKGRRTTFLAALRLLHYLGIRDVLLVGADFRMTPEAPYAYDCARTPEAARMENCGFAIDAKRLARLKPVFEAESFNIVNCTPGSGLDVFPHMPLAEAVEAACSECSEPIDAAGWADSPGARAKGGKV